MSGSNKITNLNVVQNSQKKEESKVSALSPREIVSELDRYVIGQQDAKKAVAVALRNRWRRQALSDEMREEVLPKNILMIGPTGVGKTEISRRLSKLAEAPFIKVEATRFTEVGYVGRDVEQIIRDLVEIAIALERDKKRKEVNAKAQQAAEDKVLDALVGNKASIATRESFRKRLRSGDLDKNTIEIEVNDSSSNMQSFEIPGMPNSNVGMINIGDILGKSMGKKKGKKKKMSVKESHDILVAQESDKMIEEDKILNEAKKYTEENGIVFLDEIDKVSARGDRAGGDVSREGVQRDLLPLIEGTTVNTKHGPIKTDHILFIASGAFQLAKPSDLLPELQGRLPIRVELSALNEDDFKRILKEPDNSLIKQYRALLKTENVELEFTEDGIDLLAKLSAEVNESVENIGARRLHTIIEKVLEDISFNASDKSGEKIIIDKLYVQNNLGDLVKDTDLSKFIL
jgi:ATP-dependent HslUV protease ATP-binding subunit HslU